MNRANIIPVFLVVIQMLTVLLGTILIVLGIVLTLTPLIEKGIILLIITLVITWISKKYHYDLFKI
ncbi:MAG: hypothetical protein KAS78_01620 [Candidatus Pacebacteria bacterium]|nr:hypothetical protein [Candidatus Paceibacterota bacterium]